MGLASQRKRAFSYSDLSRFGYLGILNLDTPRFYHTFVSRLGGWKEE